MEELDISAFLDKFTTEYPDLTPIQRVVLSHPGTIQTLLSMIFKVAVEVEVIRQSEVGGNILRWAKLTDGRRTFALATSLIPKEKNAKILDDLEKGEIGLGQMLERHHIRSRRKILGVYCDENVFSRVYLIEGKDVWLLITEVFMNAVFKDL